LSDKNLRRKTSLIKIIHLNTPWWHISITYRVVQWDRARGQCKYLYQLNYMHIIINKPCIYMYITDFTYRNFSQYYEINPWNEKRHSVYHFISFYWLFHHWYIYIWCLPLSGEIISYLYTSEFPQGDRLSDVTGYRMSSSIWIVRYIFFYMHVLLLKILCWKT
jgi:hypothetical protein